MKKRNLLLLCLFSSLLITGCMKDEDSSTLVDTDTSLEEGSNPTNEEKKDSSPKEAPDKDSTSKEDIDNKKKEPTSNKETNEDSSDSPKKSEQKDTSSKEPSNANKSNDLIETINKSVNSTLGQISGTYTFGFKDLNTNKTVIKNDVRKPAASVIKIYIMIEAFNQINQGKISLDQTLTYTAKDKVGGAGSIQSGPVNKAYTINELINKMMQISDNVATNMLIDHLGMDKINNTIRNLGCSNTILGRKMMDLEGPTQGRENYITPSDLVLTFEKLYKGQVVSSSYSETMLKIMEGNTMRSKLPGNLSDVRISHKTGENGGIENDAGIVYTNKGAYIITVTTDNGSSGAQRSAIANLSKKIYDAYIG